MSESRSTDAQPIEMVDAADLLATTLPDLQYVVADMVPEGLTVVAGKPKIGKSLLALDLAASVVEGSPFLGCPTVQGPVLILALEDGPRRVRDRLALRFCGSLKAPPITIIMKGVDSIAGVIRAIESWRAKYPDGRLVVIDIYGRVMPRRTRNQNEYEMTTKALGELQQYAIHNSLAVVLLHHTRKNVVEGGDTFDTAHGSIAITGVADASIIVTRQRLQAEGHFHVTGRDIAERELRVRFDFDNARIVYVGDANASFIPTNFKRLAKVIAGGATTPAEIAAATSQSTSNTQNKLSRMKDHGFVAQVGHGRYELTEAALQALAEESGVTSVSTVSLQPEEQQLDFGADATQSMPKASRLDIEDAAHDYDFTIDPEYAEYLECEHADRPTEAEMWDAFVESEDSIDPADAMADNVDGSYEMLERPMEW